MDFALFYPFSMYSFIAISLGILLVSLMWSFTFGIAMAIGGWTGILRILPIIEWFQSIIPADVSEAVTANAKVSFPIHRGEKQDGIYMWHPHGIMITSMVYHNATKSIDSVASWHWVFKWIPFMREIMDKYNIVGSGYNEMKEVLASGNSLSVAIGGVREMWNTVPNTMTLNVARKRGIFKMALETGTSLIPVLVYGENELFEHVPFEWNKWLFDTFGWFVPIPTWASIQRWIALLQGRGEPIVTHVGPAVPVAKKESPSEEDIVALRNTYIAALKELYAKTHPKTCTGLVL